MALSVCQVKGEPEVQRNQMTCADWYREFVAVGHLVHLFMSLGLITNLSVFNYETKMFWMFHSRWKATFKKKQIAIWYYQQHCSSHAVL